MNRYILTLIISDKGKETKVASRPKKSQQKRPVDLIEEEYYDYDYPESSSDYYYYEDEEPLPSGPTQWVAQLFGLISLLDSRKKQFPT